MASDLNTDHLPQPGERVGLVWDDEESPRDRAGTVLAIVSEPDVQLVCAIVLMDGRVIDCMRLKLPNEQGSGWVRIVRQH